ncbi:DUF1028 domain-containing protein [Ferrovibrio sp.]|uniref:DUF1028 domain-containing protein n=1 Tax=Ferrovibrio sp. TaxID=1917215 RepID=UPI000CA9D052|nr:DUF1028 domain-containing protein [Ferrovibrio sp.]PJI40900.1 MAG: pilus assembly protein [Ferrovibrio sp.]
MTFTIVARDKDTGLLGIAQSTNPLSVGARCPFIRANVGAVSTQAYTDPGLGPLAIELLSLGHSPEKVIAELGESDPGYAWRQIGIVDRHGRVAAHTGSEAKNYKGAVIGDGYVVMGNLLLTDQVLPDMEKAWRDSAGELFEERLMRVITAGRDAGGDAGGHRSACLMVYDTEPYGRTDLRVDFAPKKKGEPDAVDLLRRAFDTYRPMIPYYKVRPHNPSMIGWIDWLKSQGIEYKD